MKSNRIRMKNWAQITLKLYKNYGKTFRTYAFEKEF